MKTDEMPAVDPELEFARAKANNEVALAAIGRFPELDWRWDTRQKADWYAAYQRLLDWVQSR